MRIIECTTIGVVDDVRYDTLPVMDAGNDCLAIVGVHDMTGKDAIFVE